MAIMSDSVGIAAIIVTALALALTAGPRRTKLPRPLVDGLLAVEGAGLAIGGLLLVGDVGPASWIVAPLVLGVLTPLHVRALFAGEGPFRT